MKHWVVDLLQIMRLSKKVLKMLCHLILHSSEQER